MGLTGDRNPMVYLPHVTVCFLDALKQFWIEAEVKQKIQISKKGDIGVQDVSQ